MTAAHCPDSTLPGVQIHQGETYKIITLDRFFLSLAGKVDANPWTIVVNAGKLSPGEQENYE